jgi:hypothetical protein
MDIAADGEGEFRASDRLQISIHGIAAEADRSAIEKVQTAFASLQSFECFKNLAAHQELDFGGGQGFLAFG